MRRTATVAASAVALIVPVGNAVAAARVTSLAKAVRPKKKVVHKPVKKQVAPKARPRAFTVRGAPKEPLKEISLPVRADRLAAWVATKPKVSNKNVQHWLYQHAWIVAGAKFGWWHGAEALTTLIAVDQKLRQSWGIGRRSEAVARAALKRVERGSK